MQVHDDHVLTLRAFLEKDNPLFQERRRNLDPSTKIAFSTFVSAASIAAVRRRFGEQPSQADVIDYVGDVRTRSAEFAEHLDPIVGERVIWRILNDERVADIDQRTQFRAEMILLSAIIDDEHLDRAGLDRFLSEVRGMADYALTLPEPEA